MSPEIIIGPPGTGKTAALLAIVDEELAAGTDPGRIGLLSFTRRAASEAAERAAEKFGLPRTRFTHFRTLHSECFRALGMRSADVLQGRALKEFADWVGVKLSAKGGDWEEGSWGHEPGDRILHLLNLARVQMVPLRALYDQDDDALPWSEVDRVSQALDLFKRKKHVHDYTDMLDMFASGQQRVPLDVLLIDEAQDLSLLQWRVVEHLAQGCRRVVVAGDDDQSIYIWAGAALSHFVIMPGNVRVLGQSWRVPRVVQNLALSLISRVVGRRPKTWAPRAEEGVVDHAWEFGDVDLAGEDILVLARNHHVIRKEVIPVLRRLGILYEYSGRRSVDEHHLTAVRDWELARRGEALDEDRLAALAALSTRPVPAPPLEPWYDGLDRLPRDVMWYIRTARARGESLSGSPRVRLSTIHGAKGGQADHVVLMLEMAPRTWREAREAPDDEARVWYVGVTRARTRLTMVDTRSRWRYDI